MKKFALVVFLLTAGCKSMPERAAESARHLRDGFDKLNRTPMILLPMPGETIESYSDRSDAVAELRSSIDMHLGELERLTNE